MNIEPEPDGTPLEFIRPGDPRFEDTLRSFGIRIEIDNGNYIGYYMPRQNNRIRHYILGITPLGYIESRRIHPHGNLGIIRHSPENRYAHDGKRKSIKRKRSKLSIKRKRSKRSIKRKRSKRKSN